MAVMKEKNRNRKIVFVLLSIISMIMVLPFFFILFTSLKGDAEFVTGEMTLLPKEWRFQNYIDAMTASSWGTYFYNSIFVTVVTVGISIVVSLLAGYTFARMDFKGKDVIFIILLLGLMIPPQAVIIPQFIIMKNIPFFGGNGFFDGQGQGWLDSYYSLIVPMVAAPVGVFLARQFYQTFPKALDDAAAIDGAGPLRAFIRIYVPLSGPVVAAFGILKTVHVWNDFFHPLIYTSSQSMRTVQLGLQTFHGEFGVQFNYLMAATLVVSIPLILMFFMFQKQFVQSLLASSVKG